MSEQPFFTDSQREILGERTSAALQHKASQGEFTGGHAPYGFRVGEDNIHLVEDAEEQAVIARVQALRDQGKSLREIAVVLTSEGIVSRVGKPFSKTQVDRMLRPHEIPDGGAMSEPTKILIVTTNNQKGWNKCQLNNLLALPSGVITVICKPAEAMRVSLREYACIIVNRNDLNGLHDSLKDKCHKSGVPTFLETFSLPHSPKLQKHAQCMFNAPTPQVVIDTSDPTAVKTEVVVDEVDHRAPNEDEPAQVTGVVVYGTYNGITISGDAEDNIDMTGMWRACGSPENRRPVDYLRTDGAKRLIDEILRENSTVGRNHCGELTREERTRRPDGTLGPGSTKGNYRIAIPYGMYLNAKFHLWCIENIKRVIEGRTGVMANTLAAQFVQFLAQKTDEKFARTDERIKLLEQEQKAADAENAERIAKLEQEREKEQKKTHEELDEIHRHVKNLDYVYRPGMEPPPRRPPVIDGQRDFDDLAMGKELGQKLETELCDKAEWITTKVLGFYDEEDLNCKTVEIYAKGFLRHRTHKEARIDTQAFARQPKRFFKVIQAAIESEGDRTLLHVKKRYLTGRIPPSYQNKARESLGLDRE